MKLGDTIPQGSTPSTGPAASAQELQAAADALARISHELKTPLVTIKGYAELLLDQREVSLTDAMRDWVRRIAAAANRLDGIVNRVIGESRVYAPWSYQGAPLEPEGWLRRCVEEVRNLAAVRALSWGWSVEPDAPAVALDPDQGRRLLVELLQNATRATPDGGEIRVRASAEEREGKRGLRVSVLDSGVGVAAGEAGDALFGRFVVSEPLHAHHSGDFEYGAEGLGLGLSLVRGVARANGGEAWAEGTGRDPERLPGAAFHVWLPAAPGAAVAPEPPDAATALGGRLLVVDADAEVREILSTSLAEVYEVELAATESEALEKWRAGGSAWQAVVFDPDISPSGGVAFVRALRDTPGTEGAAVVSYASSEAAFGADALRAAGVDTCLWKPVRTRVILQRLQSIKARKNRP